MPKKSDELFMPPALWREEKEWELVADSVNDDGDVEYRSNHPGDTSIFLPALPSIFYFPHQHTDENTEWFLMDYTWRHSSDNQDETYVELTYCNQEDGELKTLFALPNKIIVKDILNNEDGQSFRFEGFSRLSESGILKIA